MDVENLKKHQFIVIGMEHYNPLGVIRSLGENGIRPIVILRRSSDKIASASKYIQKLHFVDDYEAACKLLLREYSHITPKPFVIPCEDAIVEILDRHYNETKDYFYVASAAMGKLSQYMSKWAQCELAIRHGLNVAKSWVVKRGEIPEGLTYPIITKPLTSYIGWKYDYRICTNEKELKQAYREVKGTEFMLQQYIKKVNECCIDGITVNRGKQMFVSMSTAYTYILPDYYSMEMVIKEFDKPEIKNTLNDMFEEVGYDGIFDVEFMIDAEGQLWFLEINFRNSAWSYASTKLGMNLPLLWAESCLIGDIPKSAYKPIPSNYIALAEVPDFTRRVIMEKQINVWQWMKGIKQANCLFFWNKKDKKPIFTYWITSGISFVKAMLFKRNPNI